MHYTRTGHWIILALLLALGGAMWRYTPLHDFLTPHSLRQAADYLSQSKAPVLLVAAAYIAASLILFPVLAMIVLTALALPPIQAIAAGIAGVAASSCTGYAIGWMLGPDRVEHFLGPMFAKVRNKAQRNSFLSVVIIRHLPLGPFTLVNLILGSMHIRFLSFVTATTLSLLPAIAGCALVGGRLQKVLEGL